MMRRLKTPGLVTLGLLMAAMPMTAHAQGVSFDGNILWNNNGSGDQYDQSTFGGLSQSTETFVTSNFSDNDIVDRNERYVWIDPEPIKGEMLEFYTHYYRPRIYVVDTDFDDGGLLLYHRDDGRPLRKDWIRPTLRNVHRIWKAPVAILSSDQLFAVTGNQYKSEEVRPISFDDVVERMRKGEPPFRGD